MATIKSNTKHFLKKLSSNTVDLLAATMMTIIVTMIVTTITSTTTMMTTTTAFQQYRGSRIITRPNFLLNMADISEWRDKMFDNPPDLDSAPTIELSSDDDEQQQQLEPLREICVLPFPITDVLVQGETKELCLYEERFHKLFDFSTSHHAGIVAMGYITPTGLLRTMALCEIQNYRVIEGDDDSNEYSYSTTGKSILATIGVVGRATLRGINDDDSVLEEYITAWCTEMTDDNENSKNIEKDKNVIDVCNELANDIDEMFDSIILLEEKLTLKQQQQKGGDNVASSALAENDDVDGDSTTILSEATLRRMKLEAELNLDDDDDDDDDNDDFLDDNEEENPKRLFEKAFQIAKSSDTQGYTILLSSSTESAEAEADVGATSKKIKKRSIQDLTALSWAYLSKDVWDEEEILKYRLQALNINNLLDRLILVYKMLLEQRGKLIDKKMQF